MILVDPAIWRWRGLRWAHLVSDSSHEELHAFAARLGIHRRWFQGDHYDIPAELRLVALELGAVPVDSRELVLRISAAGLRKRRARTPLVPSPAPPHTVAMSERTHYAPGVPSWIDLATVDPDAAMAFYGALLGWDFDIGGPEIGRYTYCRLRGRAVAGLNGRPAPEGWPTGWTTYLATADVDATAERITAGGGTLVLGPADAGPAGRTVVARDPAGAVFGAWQAGEHLGAELVNEPGTLSWSELGTPDLAQAEAFYGAVFGYAFAEVETGGPAYRTFAVEGRPVGGMLEQPDPGHMPPAWVPYFSVDDVDAAATSAQELGAALLVPPTDSTFGRWAILNDPQGAVLTLITLPPDAGEAG